MELTPAGPRRHRSKRKIFFASLLMAGASTSCSEAFPSPVLTSADQTPILEVLATENSLGSAGEALSEPVVVRATTESGRPIRGQPIDFEVVSGGGTVSVETTTTDKAGLAESEWTLGLEPGWQEVEVRTGNPTDPAHPIMTVHRVRALQSGPYTVHLSRSSLDLSSGDDSPAASAQLTAAVHGGSDEPILDVPVSWMSTAADVAAVSEDGHVTATGSGEAYVVASFHGAADSALVRVSPSGAAGSGVPLHPNEPAQFTSVSERTFASREENGWRTTSSSYFSITSDSSAPISGSAVGEVHYPAGWDSGKSPTWSEHQISNRGMTSLYVSFWLKVSDNWQGHPVNSKVAYFLTHDKPVVFPVYIGGGSDPLSTEVRIQDVPDGARNFRPNLENVTIERGEWHHWEILLVSNTGNSADGEIHWWIDGVPVGSHADVRFGTASQSKVWDRITWRPVWGGAGGQVQQDMYMWMDHFYASGTP